MNNNSFNQEEYIKFAVDFWKETPEMMKRREEYEKAGFFKKLSMDIESYFNAIDYD